MSAGLGGAWNRGSAAPRNVAILGKQQDMGAFCLSHIKNTNLCEQFSASSRRDEDGAQGNVKMSKIKMSLHVLARRLSSKSLQIVLYARNSMLALEMRIVRKHAHPFVEAHLVRGSVGRLWLLLVTTRANVLDTAATAAGLGKELVLELTVLVVTVWLLERDGNDVEDVGALLEDVVHLFEGSVSGLGEEEVGHWENEGVDDREDCCAVRNSSIDEFKY